jgi:site-specific recombinase XerD
LFPICTPMKVRIIIDKSKIKVNGECPLKFLVTLPDERFKMETGISCYPEGWNANDQIIRNKGKQLGSDVYNKVLHSKLLALLNVESELLKKGEPIDKENIKSFFKVKKKEKKGECLLNYISNLKERLQKKYSYNYLRKLTSLHTVITHYSDIPISEINETYIEKLIQYFIEHRESEDNTIATHIKVLRNVLNYAVRDGHNVFRNYKDIKFKNRSYRPVWLTWEEVGLLEKFVGNKTDTIIRDDFLFRCYTSLRDQDIAQLRKHHFIKKDYIYLNFNMLKNHKDMMLPIHEKAYDLLEKYNFRIPQFSQQTKNLRIKEICRAVKIDYKVEKVRYSGSYRKVDMIDKCDLVGTHTARRTFGRKWMEDIGDIEKLSAIYGHSSSKTTKMYIGWEDSELAKEVARLKL